MRIYCCSCDKEIIARLTNGKEIYPHRSDLKNVPFWICDTCGNYVGTHHKTKNWDKPLGVIPNTEMRKIRQTIHELLDPLWKTGGVKRKDIYAKLSNVLGRTYHTADIRSIDEAKSIMNVLHEFKTTNTSNNDS